MLAAGRVRNCVWRRRAPSATVTRMPEEQVVYREEVVALMFTVTDMLAEVRRIRRLLEGGDDGEEEEERVPE
jgi:hypothetical protein